MSIHFKQTVSKEFTRQIVETWPDIELPKSNIDLYEWIQRQNIESRLPREILNSSPLFRVYTKQSNGITHVYSINRATKMTFQNTLLLYNFPRGGNERYPPVNVPLWFGGQTGIQYPSTIAYSQLFIGRDPPSSTPLKEKERKIYNWLIEINSDLNRLEYWQYLPEQDQDRPVRAFLALKKIMSTIPGISDRWIQLVALFVFYAIRPRAPMNYHFFIKMTGNAYTVKEIEAAGFQWIWIEKLLIHN